MEAFTYRQGRLCAENVPLETLAARHGTPLYVYSRNHVRRQFRALRRAMAAARPLLCYSVKANANGAILRTLADEGAGFDVVSGGELYRALRAGANPSKIVFAGVGKTTDEIEFALRTGILFFTVESEPEMARIAGAASRMRRTARVAVRVNPDVDAGTHRHITTGRVENKFGLPPARAGAAARWAASRRHMELVGLHMHIGSQILSAAPYVRAVRKLAPLCRRLRREIPTFRFLDIGGGLGIRYRPAERSLEPAAFAAAVLPVLRDLRLSLVMEPGRFLVGNAAVLVCRVQYRKTGQGKEFLIADAAMNDLIRPSLYDAYHEVLPVRKTARKVRGDLVGPICESGDFLARDRALPSVGEGALLAVCGAGAYGFAMASNYNSRPRPAEVLVDGSRSFLIRKRETVADLVRSERLV